MLGITMVTLELPQIFDLHGVTYVATLVRVKVDHGLSLLRDFVPVLKSFKVISAVISAQ